MDKEEIIIGAALVGLAFLLFRPRRPPAYYPGTYVPGVGVPSVVPNTGDRGVDTALLIAQQQAALGGQLAGQIINGLSRQNQPLITGIDGSTTTLEPATQTYAPMPSDGPGGYGDGAQGTSGPFVAE